MSRFRNLEFGEGSEENSTPDSSIKDERYYLELAEAEFATGLFEKALRSYSKVLEFTPGNPVPWTGQVRMLIELGEFREAKVWADKALEQFPREPDLLAAKAVALARLGDRQSAIAFSDAAVEERGQSPYVWLARGDVLLAKKTATADFCIQKAIQLGGNDPFITWLASRIYYFYRKFSLAIKMAEQALQERIEGIYWLQLGLCQKAVGLLSPAEHSFYQASQFEATAEQARIASESMPSSGIWGRVRNFFS